MEWKDISIETYREYRFPDNEIVYIDEPVKLSISDNGHRIVDAAGVGHYIPKGWIHLAFGAKDGKDPYIF